MPDQPVAVAQTIGMWPAREMASAPLTGSKVRKQHVAKRPQLIEMSRSLVRLNIWPGSVVTLARALRLVRACPMKAMASTSCPCTSPIVTPTEPFVIGKASYQSPPTSRPSREGV